VANRITGVTGELQLYQLTLLTLNGIELVVSVKTHNKPINSRDLYWVLMDLANTIQNVAEKPTIENYKNIKVLMDFMGLEAVLPHLLGHHQ